jgi:hypothetical protein
VGFRPVRKESPRRENTLVLATKPDEVLGMSKVGMNRRQFLKGGTAAALSGHSLCGIAGDASTGLKAATRAAKTTPEILVGYNQEDHRRRLQNIAYCERAVRQCLRRQQITSYLPGQCSYNLGEYPCRKPWVIDDWDAQEMDRLKEQGIRLIQLHEEWSDSQRMFGAHKFAPLNPSGFRRFLEMAHQRGMRVIVYASSGFFQRTDPDFREDWARDQDLVELHYHYARCSPASPGWRAYLLPQLVRIMDEYGLDGIYNDLGYLRLFNNSQRPTPDEVLAFPETEDEDGALADLLALIYAEVKRRGGIVKVHMGAVDRPRTRSQVYDYLWVGEEVESGDSLRQAVKDYPLYVVPCLDMSRARIRNEDELYMNSIPYLQFPLLLAGRPFTGERALIPGVKYPPETECFWTRHCRDIWKYYQTHRNGPYSYGWWDSVPGRPEARATHARWLKQYLPLVEEGTWVWMEIRDSTLFSRAVPDVIASAFANTEMFLVLANYGSTPVEIETSDSYLAVADRDAPARKRWNLDARTLCILQRLA